MPCPFPIFPIRLLDPGSWYTFIYWMINSADPDQFASSEANWSGSALFAKAGYIWVQQDKGVSWGGIHKILFLFLHENMLWVLIRSASNEYHNIYFCGENRNISLVFSAEKKKKKSTLSGATKNFGKQSLIWPASCHLQQGKGWSGLHCMLRPVCPIHLFMVLLLKDQGLHCSPGSHKI